jgi:glutathione S-transferase
MSSKPVLYCFAQSGNAYKVALFYALTGQEWTPRFVDFFNGETRTPAYRQQVNEMGEVPVLQRDGQNYSQSGAILTMLSDESGQFAGKTPQERYDILRWIMFDNHKFTNHYATLRFLLSFAKTGETGATEFLRGRAKAAFKVVDAHLKDRTFMAADHATIADLSMAGYVYYPEEVGIDWADYPHLCAWRDRVAGLPGWVHPYDLMPGHPLPV